MQVQPRASETTKRSGFVLLPLHNLIQQSLYSSSAHAQILLTTWRRFARASVLELISSMRLDGRKDIQSIKSTWSIFDLVLAAHIQPSYFPLEWNIKRREVNTKVNIMSAIQ